MLTGRRFRVEFTDEQGEYAEQIGAVCRAVWNTGLEQRREYRRRGAWMNYRPQAHELAEAKGEHPWLKDVRGHCLQQTLMDLDKACRAHATFRVRWRSGRRWAPSFRFPEGAKMAVEKLNGRHGRVKLPKLGWVKFRQTRSLAGETIRWATLTRAGRHWYVSLLVAVATSAGALVDRPFVTDGEQRRAVALQRGLSKAVKGSANRTKARAALAAVRERERHRRQDFCAKAAHQLATDNAVVVLEKLRVKNMTRRARPAPDPDNPGGFLPNGAAAKSGLNKGILSKGWYRFERALQSVARYTGTEVVKVPAAFTSQRCSVCGHVDPKSRESQAVFRCTHCSHTEHADVNAAKNVLAAGLAVTACREAAAPAGAAGTPTQEPAGNREGLLLHPQTAAPAA